MPHITSLRRIWSRIIFQNIGFIFLILNQFLDHFGFVYNFDRQTNKIWRKAWNTLILEELD
jgi:hypothetical protein